MRKIENCSCCECIDVLFDTKYGRLCIACRDSTMKAEKLPARTIKTAILIDDACEQCGDQAVWRLGNGIKICNLCMDAMRLVLKEGKGSDNG